jgi:hypothetical protein
LQQDTQGKVSAILRADAGFLPSCSKGRRNRSQNLDRERVLEAAHQRRGACACPIKVFQIKPMRVDSAFGGANNRNTFGRKIYRFSNSEP